MMPEKLHLLHAFFLVLAVHLGVHFNTDSRFT